MSCTVFDKVFRGVLKTTLVLACNSARGARGFCFCREVFCFCREVFGFAVRYFVFALRFLVLP